MIVRVEVTALVPGDTVPGEKEQAAFTGSPLHERAVAELKPLDGDTETVAVTVPPAPETVPDDGLKLRVNEGVGAETVTVTAEEVEAAKFVSPA